uniref:Uncharacterized protein n=1 Tax=Setaria italica TaxID=4555 RepID=K3Z1J9_SETIT
MDSEYTNEGYSHITQFQPTFGSRYNMQVNNKIFTNSSNAHYTVDD